MLSSITFHTLSLYRFQFNVLLFYFDFNLHYLKEQAWSYALGLSLSNTETNIALSHVNDHNTRHCHQTLNSCSLTCLSYSEIS
jgi:hypothetical protein